MRMISNFVSEISRRTRALLAAVVYGVAFLLIAAPPAFACACCTNTAWRYVEIEKLESAKLAEIFQIKFAKDAKLMLGEADQGIKGMDNAEEDFKLSVLQHKDRWVFSLKDAKGRGGNLTLALPKTISIFEVDPRDSKDTGHGPPLYKEWKLNANAAGDGIFRATTGSGQKITLILHGRGGGCTDASHFSHWSLLVYGSADKYTFYGDLDSHAK
jgi:hypothetical protein